MMNSTIYQVLARLSLAEKCFKGDIFKPIIRAASKAFADGRYVACTKELDKLPTAAALLDQLVEKLRGKSVYKTLKAIREGKVDYPLTVMKGLSSLMTHTIIEMEAGHAEYGVLLQHIYDRLGGMISTI